MPGDGPWSALRIAPVATRALSRGPGNLLCPAGDILRDPRYRDVALADPRTGQRFSPVPPLSRVRIPVPVRIRIPVRTRDYDPDSYPLPCIRRNPLSSFMVCLGTMLRGPSTRIRSRREVAFGRTLSGTEFMIRKGSNRTRGKTTVAVHD